jgi:hypothetical protein
VALENEGSNPSAHPNTNELAKTETLATLIAPIAQRTRAPVFGTGGRGFESL